MVDWLLKGEPREVQLEALRRSYYGMAHYDMNPDYGGVLVERRLRDGPAKGWGHLIQMRLGKTPITLNEFELFMRDHYFERSIILSPNKFKYDWPLEAERFGLSAPAMAFESTEYDRLKKWLHKNRRRFLLSVNYEALLYKQNVALLQEYCDGLTYIGADESINIKNPVGKYSKPAVELAKLCGARRILSGKPMTQGPQDMWAQLRFIAAITGISPAAFQGTYCKMGGFQGRKVIGVKNEDVFHELIAGCSFQARQSDWLRMPGTDYAEARVKLQPQQERMYNQMQDEFLMELATGELVVADQIITKLIKLQQIGCGFIIDEFQKVHDIVPPQLNPRLNAVKELIEECEGKVLIIANHTHSINLLRSELQKYSPVTIAGGYDAVEAKRIFNGDPACRVMLGQSKAVKYGHTIVGTPEVSCSTILMYENTYSLDDRSQIEERPRHPAMEYPITVWDFVATDQDLAPIRALQLKEDVAALMLRYDRVTGILPPKPELKAGPVK